ncbi:uncharacterized protein LOC125677299 [Ostrea edulis]|uniref:uncharacterized protein LOC125677299 n=1 Tax=Ostrea edulis TaxID=37623 RepID=UPI0024AF724F|nr:uncharacterized protein LOC125677299 [Ostrea edulis]
MSTLHRRTYIVVDEAHLVPQWGEEFRPMFKNICNVRSIDSNLISVLALTATASVKLQKTIVSQLTMRKPVFLRSLPILNGNIKIIIRERPPSTGGNNKVEFAYDYIYKPVFLDLLMNADSFPLTIIYSKLKWCAYSYDLAKRILKDDMYLGTPCPENSRVVQYHSTQPENVNSQIIEELKNNDRVKVVLATIALGMGADLQNVKRIIHAGPPTSPEVYVQEVGRAGRDGQAAEAVLYFNNSDLAEKPVEKGMIEFVRLKSCRRQYLSTYFDAPIESVNNCCDVCSNDRSNIRGFKVPSLEQRHHVRLSLQTYVNDDSSGELAFLLSEEKLQTIVHCFEYIRDETSLSSLLNANVPEAVSNSLFSILSLFQNS